MDLLFGYVLPIVCIYLIATVFGRNTSSGHEPYVQYRNWDKTVADVYMFRTPRYRKGEYFAYRFRQVNGKWRYEMDSSRMPLSLMVACVLGMGILGGMTGSSHPSLFEFVVLFVMYALILIWMFASRPIRAYFILKKDLKNQNGLES